MNDKDQYQYMSDEELNKLIQDVEFTGMLSPPSYLKDQIMEKVISEKKEEKTLITTVDYNKKRNKQKQLFLYSMKVAAAAIAALYFLMTVPMDMAQNATPRYEDRMEERIREDMKEYEAENQKLLEEDKSIRTFIGNKSDEVFQLLNNFSNIINNGGNEL